MTKPALTVLMTVRNGEPYLHEAVASVLNQTYQNFRFLILDNASTDSSRDIVLKFNDPRIDLVELPEDIGQTAALNRGLQMTDTPLVARMDADDISLPHRLEKQVSYTEKNPTVALLGTWAQFVDAAGSLTGSFHPPTCHEAILDWFSTDSPFAHSTVIFRTGPVREIGGYSNDYLRAQDFALWFQVSCRHKVANLAEELVRIRIHANQSSLSDDMRLAAKWDALRVFRQAEVHDSLSTHARKRARLSAMRATLDYAQVLSQNGRAAQALRWAATACARYPDLLVLRFDVKVQIMRTLLGSRGWKVVSFIKRPLHRVLTILRWGR